MANRLGLVWGLALGGLLGWGAPARAAEISRFWVAPEPGPKTALVLHFDGDLKDASAGACEASSEGGVELAKDGKFGGALRLAGGCVEVKLKQPLKVFVVEMWVKPDRLPPAGKQAVLLDRGFKAGEQKWMTLLLESDGSVLWKHCRQGLGGGDSFLCSKPGSIKAGVWQHLGLVVGPGESAAERVYVNGRNVSGGPYAPWLDVPDDRPGTLAIGRRGTDAPNPEHWERIGRETLDRVRFRDDALVPFEGMIDELCLTAGALDFSPEPDNTFCDPEKKRTLSADPRFVPAADDLVLYASFDGGANADQARGDVKSWGLKKLELVPGVRGQALLLDPARTSQPSFHAKGNFSADAGTVAFWIRPQRKFAWPGVMFGGDGFYFSPYIMVTNNYWCHAPVYPGPELFPPEQWTHVAWTWNKLMAVLYVNGVKAYEVPMKAGATLKPPDTMGLSAPSGADAFDELKVYRRPLAPAEIRNEFLQYRPNAKPTALPAVGAMVVDLRGPNKLAGSIFSRDPALAGAVSAEARLAKGDQVMARQTFPVQSLADTPFVWELPESVGAGNFVIQLDLCDAAGKRLASGEERLVRPEYPWLHGQAGKDERVLKPFTPMERKESFVRVVGRDLTVNSVGLFEKIACWGEGLLAAPMRLEARDAQGVASAQGGGVRFTLEESTNVAWQARSRIPLADGKAVAVDLAGEMDYDGATKFTLTYGPEKGAVRLEGLSLVIPLPSRVAELYTWNIGGYMGVPNEAERQEVDMPWETRLRPEDGEVFSSKRTYHSTCPGNMAGDSTSRYRLPTVGNYMPQVWFGNDDRGLSVFGDNDKGWAPDNDRAAIQVLRRGPVAEIRLNFIASPFELARPRTIVLGVLPTPVKPIPEDFRTRHLVDDFFPFGAGNAYVADYEDPRQDLPGLKAAVTARHREGKFAQPHVNGTYFEPGRETRRLFAAEWHDGMTFAPFGMVTPSKVDYVAWTYSRLKKDIGIDGPYFDCCTPMPNFNTLSGTAYLLDDGRIQPGWTVWSEREMFKRVSHVFGDLYAENFFWGNGFYGPEINGWQIGTVVGEGCEVFTQGNREFVGRHHISEKNHWGFVPMRWYSDTIVGQFSFERIHAISQPWGLVRFWQGPNYMFHGQPGWQKDPPDLMETVKRFQRSANAQFLLLDTKLTWQDNAFPPWYTKFVARPGLKLFPFWNNQKAVATAPSKEIYASVYTAGSDLLLIAANHTERKTPVTVTLDLGALGLAVKDGQALRAVDAEADATWGKTVEEAYGKYLYTGPTLLAEEEKAFTCDRTRAKASLKFTIDAKDYRAFLLQAP